MRVMLFSTQWPEYMVELANGLAGHCEVILVIPDNHRFTETHRRLLDTRVMLQPFKVVFFRSIRENLKMLWSILKTIWRFKPDILHIQANGHPQFYWLFFLLPWRTKIINTIHDPLKHSGDQLSHAIDDSAVVFWGRIFTSRYIVHGHALKRSLSKAYNVRPQRIVVMPHGHLGIYKRFQRRNFEEEAFTVLFFGRIWKYKGLDIYIRAGNLVARRIPKVKMLIVGRGEDLSSYLDLIESRENFVVVNERVSIEEAGAYFERAAVVVLPYLDATQSGVVPVAFAYGKPVIVTNVGALPEVVMDGVTGYVVPPNDADIISKKIIDLFENRDLRIKMGKAATDYAMKELSWDSIGERTFQAYKSVSV